MTKALIRATLVGLAVGLVVSACGTPAASLQAADAVAHYDSVISDVRVALAPLVTLTDAPRGREVKLDGSTCLYTAGFFDPVTAPPFVFDDAAWPETRQRLDAALAAHGFDTGGQPRQAGADRQLEFTDAHGATVKIWDAGQTDVFRARVDAAECTAGALGLPG